MDEAHRFFAAGTLDGLRVAACRAIAARGVEELTARSTRVATVTFDHDVVRFVIVLPRDGHRVLARQEAEARVTAAQRRAKPMSVQFAELGMRAADGTGE
jgi:hypothetical protein